ncbi:hypothetical protein N7340_03265 [Comamonas aquatica]|nr:hypothetical protein [Comamonas aquatica]MDH0370808.1 hypothetical protein [Comamonas aquatica]
MAYFSGQGRVYIGARDELGNPAGLTFVGNVPELKVSLSVDTIEHQEAQSGQRLTDLQLIKTKKGEFACTLEELIATNLALALYGTTTTITPGTVTGELLPNPVTPGSLYPLTMQNVSAVQIQDSDATPKTLPASQYSVNAKHGSLVVLVPRRAARTPSRSPSITPMARRRARRCSPSPCPSAGFASRGSTPPTATARW